MASVHDVAAYILERRGPMSTMKLQKLVYYAQAWTLVHLRRPLFQSEIQAWANGPVVYELFDHHRGRFTVAGWDRGDSRRLTAEQAGLIDRVLSVYGPLSGQDLSALTHSEAPWRDARKGLAESIRSSAPISFESMRAFYSSRPPLP